MPAGVLANGNMVISFVALFVHYLGLTSTHIKSSIFVLLGKMGEDTKYLIKDAVKVLNSQRTVYVSPPHFTGFAFARRERREYDMRSRRRIKNVLRTI